MGWAHRSIIRFYRPDKNWVLQTGQKLSFKDQTKIGSYRPDKNWVLQTGQKFFFFFFKLLLSFSTININYSIGLCICDDSGSFQYGLHEASTASAVAFLVAALLASSSGCVARWPLVLGPYPSPAGYLLCMCGPALPRGGSARVVV